VQESIEVMEAPSMTLVGFNEQVRPAGVEVCVRVTVPVNPLTGDTVIVDVAGVPTLTVTLVGLAVTVKSTTWKRMFPVL
jgi:hypothetical protein